MERNRNKLTKVLELARRIVELCADEEPPQKQRPICLQCKKRQSVSGRRGLCNACWMRTRRRIDDGLATEPEIVAKGLMHPAQAGGRRSEPTDLDQFIETKPAKPRNTTKARAILKHETKGAKTPQ